MAVVVSMHWPEGTLEQYEQARQSVGWEEDPHPAGLFHIAWMADDGFRVVDVWESPEAFQEFVDTRLGPAIRQIGIDEQPNVTFAPVHRIFNPFVPMASRPRRAGSRRSRARSSSRPAARRAAGKRAATRRRASAKPAAKSRRPARGGSKRRGAKRK